MRKISFIIIFGFLGVIYGFFFPHLYGITAEFFDPSKSNQYGVLSYDETSRWLLWHLIISGSLFSLMWGWIGYKAALSLLNSLIIIIAIILVGFLFFNVIPDGDVRSFSQFIFTLISWAVVSFVAILTVNRMTRKR